MRTLNKLESFTNPDHLYNLLTFQKSFDKFLTTIRNVEGATLKVLDNMDTVVTLRGKVVDGTRARRFDNKEQLQELLNLLEL